ncbi:MAG: hypothetical protein RLZZ301_1643 [Bacteroidota bacterium]|jgi:hypothetical protein
MKNLALIWLLCFAHAFQAQDSNARYQLDWKSNLSYNSSGIDRHLTDAFFYGGHIDSLITAKSLSQLHSRNFWGMNLESSLRLTLPNQYLIQGGIYNYTGINFSKDAFGLTFLGNASYMADTALLSGTKFQSTSFSKLGIGRVIDSLGSTICFNLVALHADSYGTIYGGSIYQDPLIDSISLDVNAHVRTSKMSLFTGVGFAIDLDYRFVSADEERQLPFQIVLQNIGVAKSFQPMQSYQVDSSLLYTGFSLQQFSAQGPTALLTSLLDSLGIHSKHTSGWVLLPGMMQFSKTIDPKMPQRLQAYYGAKMYLRSTYIPCIYAGLDTRMANGFHLGIGASYGGFGGLRLQAYSQLQFKQWSLGLHTDNALMHNGASLYAHLKCGF